MAHLGDERIKEHELKNEAEGGGFWNIMNTKIIASGLIAILLLSGMVGVASAVRTYSVTATACVVHGNDIIVTYLGGPDAVFVSRLSAVCNGVDMGYLSTAVGSTISTTATDRDNHIIVTATFKDDTTQVILDTYLEASKPTYAVSTTATTHRNNIIVTYLGGPDAVFVSGLNAVCNGVDMGYLSTAVGSTISTTATDRDNHIIVTATFKDDTTQVILDTYLSLTPSPVVSPTPRPTPTPTPVPTLNLQISATPSPVEAGKTVTIRVKSNGWGVEGANVYYAKSIYGIKTGRDVVVNGKYIGTTSEGGWLSYTFDKSGAYAIGVTYNRLYNPSIEHLTVTAPTPTPPPIARPTPRSTPTPISKPVATPTPVLPISPEYFYIIPIALFLILVSLIFYARGKRKKPAKTSEKPSPPSPEQKVKEEQITPPIFESITIERAIYDPCKRDFIEKALPRMKDWVNSYDPGAYWFALSIQNNTDKTIEEWSVDLEFSSALKIKDAKIEGIEIEIPHETHLGLFKISVPKEYGIVIPKGGAQRVYFKVRAEKPKTTYEISGVFKSEITGDMPIRAKEFKYLCDTGVSPEAVKAELKKTFSGKDAARLALSFKTIQELDRMCDREAKTDEYMDKLSGLRNYTEGFSDMFTKQVDDFSRFMKEEQSGYLDDEYKGKVRRFCTNLVDVWISEFLKG